MLPLSPGRLERHGFEYYRHGTLSLYAALNTKSGEVVGKTAARHTSQEFVAFLAELVANQPRGKEIHLIADNLSAHKTKRVEQFLAAHPKAPSPLHADLLLLAQPGRKLVRQDRARCHCSRSLHLGQGPGAQADALHPPLQSRSQTHQVDLPRPQPSYQCRYHFTCYRPLVACRCRPRGSTTLRTGSSSSR